jgi:hypothetical protein
MPHIQEPKLTRISAPQPVSIVPSDPEPVSSKDIAPPKQWSTRPWSDMLWAGYGTIEDLRKLLGVTTFGLSDPMDSAPNAVLVAIDTEFERFGLINHVVEVGISVLRVPDVYASHPGDYSRNWFTKVEHRHIVLDITRKPRTRMASSLFSNSRFLDPARAKMAIQRILRACAAGRPLPSDEALVRSDEHNREILEKDPTQNEATIILAGQSLRGDVRLLSARPLNMDLRDPRDTGGPRIESWFDVLALSERAQSLGAYIPRARLGSVVRRIGSDPLYHAPADKVKGVHNAGNDAAYTLMALLLYAKGWEDVLSLAPPTWAKDKVKEARAKKADGESAGRTRTVKHDDNQWRPVRPIISQREWPWRRATIIVGLVGGFAILTKFASFLGYRASDDESDNES